MQRLEVSGAVRHIYVFMIKADRKRRFMSMFICLGLFFFFTVRSEIRCALIRGVPQLNES
jgi:hypothetical protein